MTERNVPVQSLIDHIKTAIDVDPWAKEMVEDLLKEQEAVEPYSMNAERTYGICSQCGKIIFRYGNIEENRYCGVCGKAVRWND